MFYVISVDRIGTANQAFLNTGDSLILLSGVTIAATQNYGIFGGGNSTGVLVAGTVIGSASAIQLGNDDLDFGNVVTISATGSAFCLGVAFSAIRSYGTDFTLRNRGEIFGEGIAVSLQNTTTSGISRITNHGSITGGFDAIIHNAPGDTLILLNTGLIEASGTAFGSSQSISTDWIRNRGDIIGLVFLGGGNDIFDNLGGVIEGTVLGENGDDRFVAGMSAEIFDGGFGVDTLDFSRSQGVTISLANDRPNTREALGDIYTTFENVIGSNVGADRIFGDAIDNGLDGRGGADQLFGGVGNDALTGGAGIDTLVGGVGNDTFVFDQMSDCGDTITDFRNIAADNDVIQINAARFGGGLTAGFLKTGELVQRGNHIANLATDRFIFDTTDKSLWFDQDGTGAKIAILVADLQFNATFSDFDIFFV